MKLLTPLIFTCALTLPLLAQPLPPQRQAISGLNAPAPSRLNAAELRIVTVASPLPDAINMHIVETPSGLILFDALRRAGQVADIVKVVERLNKPPLALFLTHAHSDHYGGIPWLRARFPDLPIYATPAALAAIRDDPNGDNKRRRERFGADFATQEQFDANLPNRLITDGAPIQIGGLIVWPTPMARSESPAATIYRLPQLNAAITGDLVNVLTVPAPVESLANWLIQLDQIDNLTLSDTTLYVGHGPSGPARQLVGEQRDYLLGLRARVVAALAGDNTVTLAEREAIVFELRQQFPHYRGAAAMAPDDLSRRGVEWVARQMNGTAESLPATELEVAKRAMEAWQKGESKGDYADFRALLSPDFRTFSHPFVAGGVARGAQARAELNALIAAREKQPNRLTFANLRFAQGPNEADRNRVTARFDSAGTLGSGTRVSGPVAIAFEIEDGQIVAMQEYLGFLDAA